MRKKKTVLDIFHNPRKPMGPGNIKKQTYTFSQFVTKLHKDDEGGCLDLIPSELDLGTFVRSPGTAQSKLMEFIEPIKKNYDYILLDCAPTWSILTDAAFMASNYILIPITPDPFAIIGYPLMESALEDFKKTYTNPNNVEIMGTVFTNVEGDVTTKPSKKEIEKKANYTFKNEMRFTRYYRHSVKNKVPLYKTPGCKKQFKEELNRIADEFIDRVVILNG